VKKAKWIFSAELEYSEEIHDDDAVAAYFTRVFSSHPASPTEIKKAVNDLLLDSVASNGWDLSEEQIDCVKRLLREDKNFRARFGRACIKGRKPTFDKVDLLILRNWRAIHDIKEIKHIPGLQHWHPLAAARLFMEYDENLSGDEAWFTKRIERLSLKSVRPYRVQNFRQNRDGKFVVDLD
jgi:hypothetical protein